MQLPELISPIDFLQFTLILFLALLFRYFASAGLFYWYFYKHKKTNYQPLSKIPQQANQTKKEIWYSIQSSFVFAIAGTFSYWLFQQGHTAIYIQPEQYGWWYIPVSFLLYAIIHETYYYWAHRAMHHPSLYKTVHKAHHNSIAPSPWTAFSFHPWEAFIESIILPLLLLLVPIHPIVLGCYLLLMTVSSVINHLDIEIYPLWLQQSFIGKLFIGATHHHYHHEEFNTNYGLYFTFWDKWMNTESRKMID